MIALKHVCDCAAFCLDGICQRYCTLHTPWLLNAVYLQACTRRAGAWCWEYLHLCATHVELQAISPHLYKRLHLSSAGVTRTSLQEVRHAPSVGVLSCLQAGAYERARCDAAHLFQAPVLPEGCCLGVVTWTSAPDGPPLHIIIAVIISSP